MKVELKRANKIAEKNMRATLKTMTGSRLSQWVSFWDRVEFTPIKLRKFAKRIKS